MMFGQVGPVKVFVATRPVDFRKGIDGLSLAVQEMFALDPFCGAAFVFRSKRADRIKLLMWDQTGMVLAHKRLEGGKFVWPQVQDGVMRISSAQLAALFEVVLSRICAAPGARLGHLAFECQGAFASQC
jgi:transposase